jgi:DNA-binding SARP family transcriptional activator
VTAEPALTLTLLSSFDLRADGESVALPLASQRLLAFLALREGPLQRLYVAGALWTDSNERRSYANLRSSLWRVRRSGHKLVHATPQHLALAPEVDVDVHRLVRVSRRALEPLVPEDALVHDLDGELLPDWYDEWLDSTREHVRQLRLHALEAVAERLVARRRYGQAVRAALVAVHEEPLRESAQRALVVAYLAEGNRREALVQYHRYRERLLDELAVEPSPKFKELIQTATARAGTVVTWR